MTADRPAPVEQYDEADDMCPNCVTPWKCNGPHIVETRPEPVTAPLPSEAGAAILGTIHTDAVHHSYEVLQRINEVTWLSRYGPVNNESITSWVRLVPQDDEDTVRVSREAFEAVARARRVGHISTTEGVQAVRDLVDGTTR